MCNMNYPDDAWAAVGPEGDTYTSVSGLDLDAPLPQPEGPALIARAGFNIHIYTHSTWG